MNNAEFLVVIDELCDCFGVNPKEKQLAIWFRHLCDRNVSVSELGEAVRRSCHSENRFPPLTVLLKKCIEVREDRWQQEKNHEIGIPIVKNLKPDSEWQAKMRALVLSMLREQIDMKTYWRDLEELTVERTSIVES